MSLLLRAALLGGIAYLVTRSLSQASRMSHHRSMTGEEGYSPLGERHPGENNIWPTSDSQQRATAAAGPTS